MTSLGRILVGFTSTLLAVPMCAGLRSAHAADPASPSSRASFAFVPGAIWGRYLEQATSGIGYQADAIYWFDGSDPLGRVIGDLERYRADDAKAAPKEPIVAFRGRFAAYPSTSLTDGVAVMDTAGIMIADFPRARSFAWSPDGKRLAIVYARSKGAPRQNVGRRAREKSGGVQIWDRRDGSARFYSQWPTRAGWAGSDSLLLQFPDHVAVLDTRKGTVMKTGHHGTVVSPDGLYAMWPGEEGEDTRIVENETANQITEGLFGPFRRREMPQIRSAFWVHARRADHLMCISGCNAIEYPRPYCTTEIVDVATLETIASFPGEALGPTADERGVILFRRERNRLEFRDLRRIAPRESTPEPDGAVGFH